VGLRIVQVDAFTNQPFKGNPAAVCVLEEPRHETWMQSVAREMNLSETAFLRREGDGFRLRWFTPATEVDLCGHATLASAHVLWEDGLLDRALQARFFTASGLLTADRVGDVIELNFPAEPEEEDASATELGRALAATLKIVPRHIGRNRLDYLVEADSEAQVRGLRPDLNLLREISTRGVIVTARASTPGFDFVSRFFAPSLGIGEDPVTGSAHCYLGPYWADRLKKTEFVAYQASARGGVVRVRMEDGRVRLGGQAVTVMRAELLA
jgi:PhzF family phenazine biosynthesis protein